MGNMMPPAGWEFAPPSDFGEERVTSARNSSTLREMNEYLKQQLDQERQDSASLAHLASDLVDERNRLWADMDRLLAADLKLVNDACEDEKDRNDLQADLALMNESLKQSLRERVALTVALLAAEKTKDALEDQIRERRIAYSNLLSDWSQLIGENEDLKRQLREQSSNDVRSGEALQARVDCLKVNLKEMDDLYTKLWNSHNALSSRYDTLVHGVRSSLEASK